MTAPVKFLFEDDFAGDARTGRHMVTQAAHEAAIATAKAQGYRDGLAAGEAKQVADLQIRGAAAYERIAASLAALAQGLATIEARLEAESVEVAAAVGSKLARALIAAEPFAEIEALAASSFRHLVAAPHVVVRVDEMTYEIAAKRLQEIARLQGFEGRLVVLAESDLATGNCRIEWADGGLNRDMAATEQAICDAVARYVAARRDKQTLGG